MADSNYFLSTYGAGEPADAPAPAQDAPSPQGAPAKAEPKSTGNYFSDTYGPGEGPPPEPTETKPPEGPSAAHVAAMGVGDYIDKMAIGGGKIAGGLAVLGDKIHSTFSGEDEHRAGDWWFNHVVDPYVARESEQKLGPDAPLKDRAIYGVSQTAAMIASFFLGGAVAGEAEGGSTLMTHLTAGAGGAAAPAATQAIDIGQSVLDATGNKAAAAKAAAMAYIATTGAALVPAAMGGGALAKVASGAAIGGALGEGQRQVQNTVMPESMQEPFDPLNATLSVVTGAGFGGAAHIATRGGVVEAPAANAMERAQQHAAEAAKARGEDELGQTVAATQVNAEVGAHHDAAAVHGAREAEQLADSMETRRQQAEQADADNQVDIDQGAREQGLNQAESAKGSANPTPEQGFQQAEEQAAQQKEKDYTAARNQQGEQAVEASKTEDIGAAKGGANEPKPTLAEALPPEQLAALQGLKARRAAEAAKAEPAPAPTVAERLEAQNPDDDFQRLGPEVPLKAPKPPQGAVKGTQDSSRELSRPPTEAQEPLSEAEAPETNPPPVTAQTLAERRQAALDAKMAAKVRGEVPPQPKTLETAQPNRLASIRAAAEKRQRPPLRQEYDPAEALMQEQVRRDMEIAHGPQEQGMPGKTAQENKVEPVEPTARARNKQRLEALRDEYNAGRITKEAYDAARTGAPAEKTATFAARRAENVPEDSAAFATRRKAKRPSTTDADRGRSTGRGGKNDKIEFLLSELEATNPQDPEHEQLKQELRDLGYDPDKKKPGAFAARRAENAPENEWFKDLQSRLAMSHDEAKGHLAPVSDAAAPRSFQVHESVHADSVPPELKSQIDAHYLKGGSNIKGAYDNGVVHVFADAHEAGDKEELLSTAVHELTHKGLDSFLGLKHQNVMLQIAQDIKNTQWAKEYAARRGWDMSNPWHLSRLADEYSAHMAENVSAGRAVHEGLPVTDSAPSHWQKILDSVRAGLRKIGLVKHWNDNDIAALIRQAQSHVGADTLRAAREGSAYKDSGGARFSLDNDDKYMEDHYPPDHPLAVAHKFGRTMEEQAKYNPGFVSDAKTLAKDLGEGVKPDHILGAIGLRNIPDFIRESKMPSARGFIDDHDALEGRRRQILNPKIDLAKEWSQWQARQDDRGESLSDLMHAATLSGHDPSKPYVERHTAEERALDPEVAKDEKYQRAMHKSLKDDYNKLDDKGRSIFNRVRDSYDADRTNVMKGIEDRIKATGADEQTKKNALSSLRKAFESGKVKGAYFPLQRFGDLWANAKDTEGNTHSFARFESRAQRKQWLAEMRKQDLTVDSGERMDVKSEMERISPEFVKNVLGHIEAADPTGALAKDVWQEYLKAMPEMSMRKHAITRVGRLGFSGDALRAFAYNGFHGAHQLARLEFGQKLDTRMENIKNEARALEQTGAENPDDKAAQSDAKWAPAIAREMAQRYDWLRNPRSSKLASAMTRFGFSWYLGAAPATAFRIFSQNPMLAHPILASRYGGKGAVGALRGQAAASRELIRASMEWAGSRGSLGDRLRGDERRAFDEADQRGVFSDTNTQMMASGGDGSPLFKGPWYQFQKYAGFLFNAMEHHNRMTTLLAAYRLGRGNGLGHDEASRQARSATWDAHFDYTNANRPRYIQGNVPKVIGLFKQYALGVTYRLAREGADLVNSEKTPEERQRAAVALSSLIGRMMLFAGVTGVPGYWIAEKVVNSMLGDKDKPYDMTAELHTHLVETMGKTAADSIMTGPVGAISGASLSGGASYNDLWYKEPMRNETPREEVFDAMGQLMGPLGALPINAAQGLSQIRQGDTERGLEHFLPPEAAALAKAVRYATQGATNTTGENILAPGEEITNRDVALQAVGFTPQKVADAYRRNAATKNRDQVIEDRRKLLSGKYESALLAGDQKGAEELWPQIQKFNETNPGMAIGKGLAGGVLGLAKRRATAQQGVNEPPGISQFNKAYK